MNLFGKAKLVLAKFLFRSFPSDLCGLKKETNGLVIICFLKHSVVITGCKFVIIMLASLREDGILNPVV